MASWKKIIVSGSSAHLTAVTASNLTNDNLLIAGAAGEIEGSGLTYDGTLLNVGSANIRTTGVVSGSQFSGSFYGDGSALTGIATNIDIAGTDQAVANIDLIDKGIQFTTGSNGGGFTFITGSEVTFGGKNFKELILEAPQDLRTSGDVQFNQVSIGGAATLNKGSNDALVIDAGQGIVLPQVSSSITPTVDNVFDLGTSGLRWNDIHGRTVHAGTAAVGTITGSNATLTVIGGAIDIDAAAELSIDAVNAVTITSTNSTVTVEGITFNGNNVTIPGNLTVEGSQINAQVANLDVQDRFILLNSGSSTIGDSGIVFGGSVGNLNSGSALVWDASYNSNDGRLGVVAEMGGTDTGNQTIAYHMAGVYEGTEAAAATAQADHAGNIRIDGDDIFIYV